MNISTVSIDKTARTRLETARQRAEHLSLLGAKNVLELCVGPSLQTLEKAYKQLGIEVTGNDIEERYRSYYPRGKWIIGDACEIDCKNFDAIVVAPPLSKGCSGKREDSLAIFDVAPKYESFINASNRIVAFVLPGKTLKCNKADLYKFISMLQTKDSSRKIEVIPLVLGCTKYVDLYWYKDIK
jgi:hypothetical protein